MNVWIMNLKDNRDDKPNLEKSKFEFCKQKEIVGIGWAGFDCTTSNDTAFLNANAAISAFNCDDLVWVHNTDTKEYYICQITGQAVHTNDKEYNEFDIGSYCTCKYYFVGTENDLPEGITGKDLISRPTISGASESVSKISISCFSALTQNTPQTNTIDNSVTASFYGTNQEPKKKSNKKKIIIICSSIVFVIAIVFLGITVSKTVIRSTHPVLPNSWNFGDTPEIVESNPPLYEQKTTKDYTRYIDISAEELSSYFKINKTSVIDSNPIVKLNYNSEKKLYGLFAIVDVDYDESLEIVKYYEKALNKKANPINSSNGYDTALYNDDITVSFSYNKSLVIYITSSKYLPKYFEASESDLSEAYSQCKFQIGGMFSMSLVELLNLCAPDSKATYIPYRDAINSKEQQMLSLEKKGLFDSLEKSDIVDYLSSSYIIYVHGDICSNPKMPYYRSNDIDIVSVLIVFDETGNYKGYKILDYCNDLQTYATIKMASSHY